jgi:threonine synthase
MNKFLGYRCSLCNKEYLPDQVTYTCPVDGGNLDVIIDIETIRKKYQPDDFAFRDDPSLWCYLPLIPVNDPRTSQTPLSMVGGTPIYSLHTIGQPGLRKLWLKDESRNPTASFKDRASAIVVARARDIVGPDGNPPTLVTASTGNAGAALAGMAAALGQKAIIFAPKTAPQAKVAQLLIYGAKVILVDGSYDDAFELTIKASNEFGWYCRNTGYNPFTIEGKKTAAFEIWEWWTKKRVELRLGRNHSLTIFVSVGDGNIISGIHKGFKDLLALGWLDSMPRLIGVQAEGSAAISHAYHAGTEIITPVAAKTLADSISVDLPRDGVRAVRAASETGGTFMTVSDNEILSAIADLGRVGIFAEPAGAAAYAGLVKMASSGSLDPEAPVLVLNTGSGLKDVRAAMQAVPSAPIIEPTLEALKKIL